MKPYIPDDKHSPRPGCPCCKGKFMDGHNDRSESTKQAKRSGKKAKRRELKKDTKERSK